MKVLHIHATRKVKLPDLRELKKVLKKYEKVGLVSSIQYTHLIPILKQEFKNKVLSSKGLYYEGQVLGCNSSAALKIDDKVQAYIFLGEGEFHGINVSLETRKPVYIFNLDGKISELNPKYVELHEKKRFAMISKALRAKNYGILLSTKPGQEFVKLAKNIQEKLNCYIFVMDTLNFDELNNFPNIDCWINTMCPRLIDDAIKDKFGNKAFINMKDVKYLLK